MCFTKIASVLPINNLNQQLLDLKFGDDFSDNCDYLDIAEVKDVNIGDNDISVIQLNIRGAISKLHELLKFINSCNKRKIDVILLVKTWVSESVTKHCVLPGYDFLGNPRTNKKGGGVGIFINKQLQYKSRHDLHLTSENFENISIEIKTKTTNVVLSSIYRPPNTNQKEFIAHFESLHKKVNSNKNLSWVIGLDHYMDFLKHQINMNTQLFIEKISDLDLFPMITCPTRITRSTATLIDNIIVSRDLYAKSTCGIVLSDLSDHLPCITSF